MNGSAMDELRRALGLTENEFAKFAAAVSSVDVSPKAELMHRLNLSVQGIDPGPSINWRGERALYGMWQETVKAQSSPDLTGLKNPDKGHKR